MNFFKALFGSKPKTPEEDKKETEEHNFDVLKYDGKQAMMQGNTEYAVKCLTHALKIKDDPETRDYLSQALIRQGDLLMAYEHLQKLAETEPDNVKIYIRMANVAYMMEDYNAMSNACEKAMLIDKDMPELMYLYAQACIGLKDSSNAVAMLTKAINLREDYGDAYLLRGETLLADGKLDDAAEDVAWLMERYSETEEVLMLNGRTEPLLDRCLPRARRHKDGTGRQGRVRRGHEEDSGDDTRERQGGHRGENAPGVQEQ